jgi:hypothetical protein
MKGWHVGVAAAIATVSVIGTARAITDKVFTYSSAKTGFYTINANEVTPQSSGVTYASNINQLSVTAQTNVCFAAAVHLPQAATITQMTVWYQSGAGAFDQEVALWRVGLSNGGDETIFFATAHDDSNTRKALKVTPAAGTTAVNNGTYRYTFVICPTTTDNVFYGARIAYTYTSAGD